MSTKGKRMAGNSGKEGDISPENYKTCSCNIYFGTWCCWIYICKWKNRQNAKRKH